MNNNLPYDLDKEEQALLEAYEQGDYVSVPDLEKHKKRT